MRHEMFFHIYLRNICFVVAYMVIYFFSFFSRHLLFRIVLQTAQTPRRHGLRFVLKMENKNRALARFSSC